MNTTAITNTEDLIDSRDIIARIEHLSDLVMDPEMDGYLPDADPDDVAEFEALRDLHNEAKDYVQDWEFGATLIRDSYFLTYAQELADDIGAINAEAGWPLSYIDWDRAADALRMDYSPVEFDGITYWVR